MGLAQQVQGGRGGAPAPVAPSLAPALAAENQEERLFFKETALIYCENLEVQIAVFCMLRDGNSYEDLLFVYLQPSVGWR